jgi:hypothetical protein
LFRVVIGRGHTKETDNCNATAISEDCCQPELNVAAQIKETATQVAGRLETQFPGNGASQSSHNCVAAWFPSVRCSITRCSDSLVVKMVRKIDEAANFIFVQLIDRKRTIYDKHHAHCARRDKMDLALEESGICV